ncbi:MAG: alanine--glyoxylate aminotransferase family protein [Candidatus Omnitrophica bacterium]|nr:alanine--glyoxylate aminotransferase family protein [Candidatus Omnitrophota bacterium]
MKRNLLLTPGPTQIPPNICAALGEPIIHHRTPQFQEHLKKATEGLQYVFQTTNDVYMIPASGTGGMEAAVANTVSCGDKVITVEGGKFGERWTELCKAYGAEPQVIKVEWGKAVDPGEIKALLDQDKDIKAVFTTLNETSTGVVSDIKSIGEIVKDTNAILVVDAVSGLGVVDCQTDQWHVDIVVSGSHKGFMLPPGIAFISVSEKAFKCVECAKSPRYYFDLRKAKKAWEKVDTAFTPAIGIVIALNESLKWFYDMGMENVFKYYERLAQGVRAAAKALNMELYADDSCISNVLTAINIPEGVDGGKLVKIMRDQYGVTTAGGQAELKGKIIRIAHMGCLDEWDMITGISCMEKVLHQLGHKFELGAGVAAAQKYYNQ